MDKAQLTDQLEKYDPIETGHIGDDEAEKIMDMFKYDITEEKRQKVRDQIKELDLCKAKWEFIYEAFGY